jgi:hypothetical protein
LRLVFSFDLLLNFFNLCGIEKLFQKPFFP